MTTSPATGTWFEGTAPTTSRDALEALFDGLLADLRAAGLTEADVVRNRVVAATRAGRDAASAVRFARLSGPARCATSSYIDPSAVPERDGVRIDTLAIAGFGSGKLVAEHEPRQPPCILVANGPLVFFAGITSLAPDWAGQREHVRRRISETLGLAQRLLERPVRPTWASAWVHRTVEALDPDELAAAIGLEGVAFRIERCEGYSKPGKLIEVEIDAVAG